MTKKIKILITAGGTGGHVFPAYSLANHFVKKRYKVELVTDTRGYRLLKNYKDLKLTKIPSTPFLKNTVLMM